MFKAKLTYEINKPILGFREVLAKALWPLPARMGQYEPEPDIYL